jgi:hypothetical protein
MNEEANERLRLLRSRLILCGEVKDSFSGGQACGLRAEAFHKPRRRRQHRSRQRGIYRMFSNQRATVFNIKGNLCAQGHDAQAIRLGGLEK